MKVIALRQAKFEDCVKAAEHERVVLTHMGKPVALVVGVAGLDLEQIERGSSDQFWRLIRRRRQQKTLDRAELEDRLK